MKKGWLVAIIIVIIVFVYYYISDEYSSPSDQDIVERTAQSDSDSCEDLYISPDGADSKSGLSEDKAKNSLAEAFRKIKPGCTIHVLAGTYEQSVLLHEVGNANKAITIKGVKDAEGNLPLFDGGRTKTTGIEIAYSKNLVISTLAFKNYTDQGVFVYDSSDIIIEHSLFEDNGFASKNPDSEGEGFGLNVDTVERVIIRNNQAYRNGPNEEGVRKGLAGTGINTYVMKDSVIENNIANENIGGGFLVEDSIGVRVEGNIMNYNKADYSFDQWWDAGLWVDGGKDIIVKNNTAIGNEGPGFEISDEDDQAPTGYVITDNFLKDNYYAFFSWMLGACPYPDEKVAIFENNTIEGSIRQDVLCFEGDYDKLPG